MAGDGATLVGAAGKASSSLPILLQMGKVTMKESVQEMTAIQLEHDIRILDGVAIPLAICRKMLTAVEMEDTMAEIKAYCTSPLHNQFPEEETHPINLIPVPADLQDEEEVVTWVTSLKTSGQENFMEQKVDMLAIKTDTILKQIPDIKRPFIKKTVEA